MVRAARWAVRLVERRDPSETLLRCLSIPCVQALDLFAPHIKVQLQGIRSLTKMVAGEKSLTRRGARLLGNLLRKLNLLFALDEYDELRGKRNTGGRWRACGGGLLRLMVAVLRRERARA